MSEREIRYQVHFVKSGQSNRVIAGVHCLARFVVTAAGAGGARLRVFDTAVATGMNATLTEKAVFRSLVGQSFPALGVALEFATGLIVSCSGTSARAMVLIRTIK